MPSPDELDRITELTEMQKKIMESIPVRKPTGPISVEETRIQEKIEAEAPIKEAPIKDACNSLRANIRELGQMVYRIKYHSECRRPQADGEVADQGEMIANAMLAYRHLEDARMRLGKVIQAYEGGVSIFDR